MPRQSKKRPKLRDYASWAIVRAAKLRQSRFNRGDTRRFYDSYFTERHVRLYEGDPRMVLRRHEVLRVLGSLDSRRTVLDIGCGLGDVLRSLNPRLRRVGIDPSRNSLLLARRIDPNITFISASAYSLPLLDAGTDAVICLEVIEHLENDEAAVLEIARVLKPGGLLICSAPSHHYFRSYRGLMGHYRHYSRDSLESLLAAAGLDTVSYLNPYPAFNRSFLYAYSFLRLFAIVVSGIARRNVSPYEVKLPWMRCTLCESLTGACATFLERDKRLNAEDLASMEDETFLLAQKPLTERISESQLARPTASEDIAQTISSQMCVTNRRESEG